MMLIKSAIEMKLAYDKSAPATSAFRRPQFWTIHPWQCPIPEDVLPLRFPPPDLLDHLVSVFLTQQTCTSTSSTVLHSVVR